MKKIFKRKNIILTLFLSFMLFLGIGSSLRTSKAKALDSSYAISDYAWANYMDISKLVNGQVVTVSSVSDYPYFIVQNTTVPVDKLLVARDIFGDNGCLSYCEDDIAYTLRYEYYLSNIDPSLIPGLGLALYDNDTHAFLDWWAYLYNGYSFVVPTGRNIDLYVILSYDESASLSTIPANSYIGLPELAVYRGIEVNYDYTPYFYSLESLPDDGGSGDSGSGDSGSDTPDVPDGPDVPDIPEIDGNYQEGYLAGLAQAQYGFLGTNNIFLVITYTGGNVARYKIEPTRIFGGLDFTNVYNDYVSNLNDTVSSSRLEFYFSPFVRPSALSLYGEGSTYFFNSNMVVNPEVSGNSNPVLNWHVSSDNSTLYETTLVRGENLGDWKAVSLFSANYASFDFLKGLRLFVTDSNLYENGYLVGSGEGYDKGYYKGLEASQPEIYNNAYNEGHRIGYDDGFVVGSRASNSFLGLFTAVIDAPVLTFTSMLDFDVLGYNMKSIVLSLLSIALVVAIIRLFSKGGSAG